MNVRRFSEWRPGGRPFKGLQGGGRTRGDQETRAKDNDQGQTARDSQAGLRPGELRQFIRSWHDMLGGLQRLLFSAGCSFIKVFLQTPKPTRHIRETLAKDTGLPMRVIQVAPSSPSLSPPSPSSPSLSYSSFSPTMFSFQRKIQLTTAAAKLKRKWLSTVGALWKVIILCCAETHNVRQHMSLVTHQKVKITNKD